MADGGWVKLHRKMTDWEWFSDVNVAHLFLYLILMANHEDKRWHGFVVNRGQIVTSRDNLSLATGLTVRQVRTALDKLEKTGEIEQIMTNKYRIITVCKYCDYQLVDEQERPTNDQQMTNKKPTNDQQMATNKNIRSKEDNNINTLSPARVCTCEGGEDEFDRYAAFLETWVAKFKESHGGQEPSLDMLTKNRATSITYNIERAMKNDGVEINEEKFRLYLAQWLGRGWESVDDFARGQWSLAYIEKNFDYINSSVHGNKERAAVAGATHGKCNGQTIQIKRASGGYESDI